MLLEAAAAGQGELRPPTDKAAAATLEDTFNLSLFQELVGSSPLLVCDIRTDRNINVEIFPIFTKETTGSSIHARLSNEVFCSCVLS